THEEVARGTLAELAAWAGRGVLGEITLVVAGAPAKALRPGDPGWASSLAEAVAAGGAPGGAGGPRKAGGAAGTARAGPPRRGGQGAGRITMRERPARTATLDRMSATTRHILAAPAWPYANGPRHIGHVSGFGLPCDMFARYQRMAGSRVLMVSGTDEHGTPI